MKSFYFYSLIIQEGHRKTNSQPETTVPTPADHTSRTLPPVLVWVGAVPRLWRWWRQKDENGQSGLPFKCWRVGLKAPRKFDPMGTNLQSKTKTTSRWVKISFFHLEGKMGANKKCWDRILDETRPWRVDTGTGNQQEGTTDIKTVTRDAEQHRKFHPSNTFIKGLVWFSFLSGGYLNNSTPSVTFSVPTVRRNKLFSIFSHLWLFFTNPPHFRRTILVFRLHLVNLPFSKSFFCISD